MPSDFFSPFLDGQIREARRAWEAGGLGIKPEQHASAVSRRLARRVAGHAAATFCQGRIRQNPTTHRSAPDSITPPSGRNTRGLRRTPAAPEYTYATDDKALEAFMKLARAGRHHPRALESATPWRECMVRAPKLGKDALIIVNLSGRGEPKTWRKWRRR